MGIMDAFSREDRIEVTVSQLYDLVNEACRADLFRNGVKNRIPYEHILAVIDGTPAETDKTVVWHDAKTDPPKCPGLYYGKKDNTNSMWLCNFRDGKWFLDGYEEEMKITLWAEYVVFVEYRRER